MSELPSPNGLNGRDSNAQFTKGNKGGPGNPLDIPLLLRVC